jgi:hypothetical protein
MCVKNYVINPIEKLAIQLIPLYWLVRLISDILLN